MSLSSTACLDGTLPTLEPSRMPNLQSDAIGKPLAHAIAGHHRHAILILDAVGVVRFAATRTMFGLHDDELPDTHIQEMIPGVPIREATPGYNVA